MTRLLVAGTNNRHKVEEIAPVLAGLDVVLRPACDYGAFHPVENGETLEANALIKAVLAMSLSGEWAIADDTGLEVDALGGRPGIHAARYAGPACRAADNVRKLLGELDGVPDERRTARFVCVIALCRPGQSARTFRASVEGRILRELRGTGGFGYDPVFFHEATGKTFAELSLEEKNRWSHRAQAVRMLRDELVRLLSEKGDAAGR